MSLTELFQHSCVMVRRLPTGAVDEAGDEIVAETTTVVACNLQQRGRDEHEDPGEISDTKWTLFLPLGTAIHTGDSVLVDDLSYEVIGEPWQAAIGSAAMHHVEATLRRTSGLAEFVAS